MKFLYRFIVLSIIFIFALTLAMSAFLDQKTLKSNLQFSLDKAIDGDFTIDGAASISFLPLPKIIIERPSLMNAVYNNNIANITMEKLILNLSINSLVSGNIKINKVEFISPVLELDFIDPATGVKVNKTKKVIKENKDKSNEDGDKKDGEMEKVLAYDDSQLVGRIFNFNKDDQNSFDLKKIGIIAVENGILTRKGLGGEVILDLQNINFISGGDIENQSFEVSGNFLVNDIPTQFDLLLNTHDNENSKLVVNSPILKLELEGEFVDSDINNIVKSSFSGRLQADIVNPKEFFNKYFSKYILIYGRVNSVSAIKLAANIESIKGNYKISDIKVDSTVISGSGYINADLSSRNAVIKSDIKITHADIDSLWSARYVGHSNEIIDFEKGLMEDFINGKEVDLDKTVIISNKGKKKVKKSMFDSVDMDAVITVNKAKYSGKFLEDAFVTLNVSKDGELQIKKASMRIPDGGTMNVVGLFKKKNNISSFEGSYEIDGKDFMNFLSWIELKSPSLKEVPDLEYDLSGKIIVLSNFSALKDLSINLSNDKNKITGNIRYDNSKDLQNVDARLKIDNLNLTDYFSISFERNQYISPGSLSKKLLWLNTIEAANDFSLKIDQLMYRDHVFNDQEINFRIAPGIISLKNLTLQSQDEEVDVRLSLSTDLRVKPKIEIDLEVNNFKYLTTDFEDNKKFKRLPFSTRLFLFPNLADFDGGIKIKSSHFMINDIDLSDVSLSGVMTDGVWNIKDGTFKTYGGDFKYNGDVVVREVKSINGNFVYSGVDNEAFLKNVLGLRNVGGVSNVSGILNASGENYKTFIKSLNTKLQFRSANVTIDKFGLGELLKRMLLTSYSKLKIDRPDLILFNQKYSTTFKEANGSVEVNSSRNEVKIAAGALGMNAVVAGSVDFSSKSFAGLSKIVFLTGTRKTQIPINIAISHKGTFSKLRKSVNLDQVEQYLGQKTQKKNDEEKPALDGVAPLDGASPVVDSSATPETTDATNTSPENQKIE